MLKILPILNLNEPINHKFGEIFCDNFRNFTIFCCVCEMKFFIFDEFQMHLHNAHFDIWKGTEDTVVESCEQIKIEICNEEFLVPRIEENGFEGCDELEDCGFNILHIDKTDDNCGQEVNVHYTFKKYNENSKHETAYDEEINQEYELNLHEKIEEKEITKKSSKKRQSIHRSSKTCPECKVILPREVFINKHVFDCHGGYKCSKCDKRYRMPHHRRRHEATHDEEKKYKCPIPECKSSFTYSQYLKNHLDVHKTERNFICDYIGCNKAFPSIQRLRVHAHNHDSGKKKSMKNISMAKTMCDICGVTCNSAAALIIHQRVHTGERPHVCGVCKKSYATMGNYKLHMATHSGERPFVCEICQATFAKKEMLKRHRFIHSEERKFECQICKNKFKQRTGLVNHILYVHKTPNPKPRKRPRKSVKIS